MLGAPADNLPTLISQLRKAAGYVLERSEETGVSAIIERAEAIGVKPNTLVRIVQAVCFEGDEGFRQPFRESIREGHHGFPDRAR